MYQLGTDYTQHTSSTVLLGGGGGGGGLEMKSHELGIPVSHSSLHRAPGIFEFLFGACQGFE